MTVKLLQGDCRDILKTLPDRSVHCCVTSPPYYGLRDYGVIGQIGLEQAPEEYIQKLVEVFREVKRVLRDDGTIWVNIGDSYAGTKKPSKDIKPKDLIGIPWMLAFALRADGWYLRAENIWNKPNPMPESVTDRTTKSHEQIFLLTKSASYYYDHEAIKEPADPTDHNGISVKRGLFDSKNKTVGKESFRHVSALRNKRSVWTVPTIPYSGSHFATFPPDLIKPCIMAGTSEKGCCPKCEAPLLRVVETIGYDRQRWSPGENQYHTQAKGKHGTTSSFTTGDVAIKETAGWSQTCACYTGDPVPCTVMDPFAGSGTTGYVCTDLGRDAILIELNPEYTKLQKNRCGLFHE